MAASSSLGRQTGRHRGRRYARGGGSQDEAAPREGLCAGVGRKSGGSGDGGGGGGVAGTGCTWRTPRVFVTSSTAPRIALNQLSAVQVTSIHPHAARALVRTAQSWVTPPPPLQHIQNTENLACLLCLVTKSFPFVCAPPVKPNLLKILCLFSFH